MKFKSTLLTAITFSFASLLSAQSDSLAAKKRHHEKRKFLYQWIH